ncbi:MAG: C4-dicarboxylate ABC transporter substrate-binding protein [Blastopirellula sp.]|nr:MAG: C4-dicarboxylate ABC transporter substrate-binding protein [Blastopirellula sp.]
MRTLRRTFITGVSALLAVSSPISGYAADKVLKLASFVPPIYILHKPIFEKLATDLDAATNGSVKIQIYPSGELGKGPVEQYKRAVTRIAEISYGLPGYTSSVFPKTLLIELPGVTKGHEDATAKLWKVMDTHLRGEFKKTVPLALFVTPPAVFMMRDKPVRSLADLAGLKIRVSSSSAASIVEAYGATAVPMPANKVYTSMSTGVVDGALMGSDSLLIFKLIETTKYITTNLPEMPTTIFLVANEEAYNELSDSERGALNGLTGLDISQRSAAGLAKFGQIALSKFAGIEGTETIVLSDEARAAFDAKAAEAVAGLLKKLDGEGLPATEVVGAMKQ